MKVAGWAAALAAVGMIAAPVAATAGTRSGKHGAMRHAAPVKTSQKAVSKGVAIAAPAVGAAVVAGVLLSKSGGGS